MTADSVEFFAYRGSKENRVVPVKTTRQIGPKECLVEVTHSGFCATDTHLTGIDMALGHEGVGIVVRTGSLVTHHKLGDRVGWGFVHEACFNCKQCLSGGEIYCLKRKMFTLANTDQGSMGSHSVLDENFLFPIPDGMASEDAAPLMCAGASVFGSLQQRGYKSTDRVGVIGIGGLGHLAIQFAHKMGMEVVAFSTTESKRAEALQFGADAFYVTGGLDASKGDKLPESVGRLDHLLVCSTAQPDWHLFLDVLEPRATIYPLTAFEKDVTYPHLALIFSGVTIQGTMIATKQGYIDMMRFCVKHDIKPVNKLYPLTADGIETCKKELLAGKVRYRGVLVAEGADRSAEGEATVVVLPETKGTNGTNGQSASGNGVHEADKTETAAAA